MLFYRILELYISVGTDRGDTDSNHLPRPPNDLRRSSRNEGVGGAPERPLVTGEPSAMAASVDGTFHLTPKHEKIFEPDRPAKAGSAGTTTDVAARTATGRPVTPGGSTRNGGGRRDDRRDHADGRPRAEPPRAGQVRRGPTDRAGDRLSPSSGDPVRFAGSHRFRDGRDGRDGIDPRLVGVDES